MLNNLFRESISMWVEATFLRVNRGLRYWCPEAFAQMERERAEAERARAQVARGPEIWEHEGVLMKHIIMNTSFQAASSCKERKQA